MPVYTYHCENCGHEFDKRQRFSEKPLIACPNCRKHRLRKVYSPAGVVFKGSGFYVNDKRAPSSTRKAANSKPKKDAKKPEKKAEPKAEKSPAKAKSS